MPTSASAGFSGKVLIAIDNVNFIRVGEVRDATITISQDAIDATSFDSVGWHENIVGLKAWEATLEALYINQSYSGNIGQVNLQNALLGAQVIAWQFIPRFSIGDIGYVGSGFVNNFEVNIPVDDAVSLSIGITGSGPIRPFTLTPAG